MRPLACFLVTLLFVWPVRAESLDERFQRGRESLARGQQLREESAGTANEATGHAAARDHLRAAVRELNAAAESVERQLVERRLRRAAQPDGAMSNEEIESLQSNISFQLARAHRQLGLCYPPGSPDWDDALLRAAARLEPLVQHTQPDELEWNARVEWLACQRELGRLQAAGERLRAWSRDEPPPDVAPRLAAQLVRWEVAAGRPDKALELAGRPAAGATDNDALADLALARLEASLAVRQRRAEDGADDADGDITAQVDAIGRDFGPYWQRRAQLLAGRALATSESARDGRSLLLAAENLYHHGRLDDAVARFDQAIAAFDHERQLDEAFDASMTAAAIEREAGQLRAAADRYRRRALRQPTHHRAADAHRRAILSLADALRQDVDAGHESLAPAYERLLTEHLTHWPKGETSHDVRLWLGRLLATHHRWAAARATLADIEPSADCYPDAIKLTADCYRRELRQRLDGIDAADSRPLELLAAARTQLQPIITGAENRWPQSWSGLQRDVAVALARLHLEFSVEASPYAERLLAAALRGPPADDVGETAAWEATARSLLVVALARNGKPNEARAIVAQLASSEPAPLLDMLAGIHHLMEHAPSSSPQRHDLGQLTLEVIDVLEAHRPKNDDAAGGRLEKYRAAALAATGRRAAAIGQLAELAAASPDDGALHEQYAALLAAGDSPAELRDALAEWQTIEDRSRPASPRWNRARKARIELLARLGQHDEAEKLRRLTRLLYPDWSATSSQH